MCDRQHAVDATAWSYTAARRYAPSAAQFQRMRAAKRMKALSAGTEFGRESEA
jgi:hypothetical protein